MTILDLQAAHVDDLLSFMGRLPAGDLTFIKDDVSPAAVSAWPAAPGHRWVALRQDGSVAGFAALLPLSSLSDHVAELRLVVDPVTRGQGIGRELALHALGSALRSGLLKVIVEIVATQERTIEMFLGLGFTGEALLRDHFRDRSGDLQDLIMLAHFAEQTFDAMDLVGVADALEGN